MYHIFWSKSAHTNSISQFVPFSAPSTPVCAPPTNDPVERVGPLSLALVPWASLGKSGNRLERSTGDIFADRDETRHICRAEKDGWERERERWTGMQITSWGWGRGRKRALNGQISRLKNKLGSLSRCTLDLIINLWITLFIEGN